VQHRLGEEGARGKVGARIDRDTLGREVRHRAFRRRPGRVNIGVAFAKQHERHVAAQKSRRRDDDPLKHRLRVGRRLADDAEDLGRGRLPRHRLGEFAFALGKRGEQSLARRPFRRAAGGSRRRGGGRRGASAGHEA